MLWSLLLATTLFHYHGDLQLHALNTPCFLFPLLFGFIYPSVTQPVDYYAQRILKNIKEVSFEVPSHAGYSYIDYFWRRTVLPPRIRSIIFHLIGRKFKAKMFKIAKTQSGPIYNIFCEELSYPLRTQNTKFQMNFLKIYDKTF